MTQNAVVQRFPFLTLFKCNNVELVGIVQNRGSDIVSIYVYNLIDSQAAKKKFLEMGDIWWSESNRRIPINLFFKQSFDCFDFCLQNYNVKEIEFLSGYVLSLENLYQKRVKRKRIELVRYSSKNK